MNYQQIFDSLAPLYGFVSDNNLGCYTLGVIPNKAGWEICLSAFPPLACAYPPAPLACAYPSVPLACAYPSVPLRPHKKSTTPNRRCGTFLFMGYGDSPQPRCLWCSELLPRLGIRASSRTGCFETGSPKGFPESREQSDR